MASTGDIRFNVDIRVFKGDELVKLIEDTRDIEYPLCYKMEVAWAIITEALDAFLEVDYGTPRPKAYYELATRTRRYLEEKIRVIEDATYEQ